MVVVVAPPFVDTSRWNSSGKHCVSSFASTPALASFGGSCSKSKTALGTKTRLCVEAPALLALLIATTD